MDKVPTDPATMPDGMQIDHQGTIYTAFPPMPWLPGFRWHGDDDTLRDDDGMRGMLADGATVLGVNQEEIDQYHKIMDEVRERNEHRP
jgi:hypothetical protein